MARGVSCDDQFVVIVEKVYNLGVPDWIPLCEP
jgi:hypothetical protein